MNEQQLPPLPESVDLMQAVWRGGHEFMRPVGSYYTADQMQAYARAALAANVMHNNNLGQVGDINVVESKLAANVPDGYKLVLVPDELAGDEPDWDECKRQAEEAYGLKVGDQTMPILIREVRRWIAQKLAAPAPEAEPIFGPEYVAGNWSRRTHEAFLRDQGAAPAQEAERPTGPIDVSFADSWTDAEKVGFIEHCLRWPACGYVNSQERVESIRLAWKIASDLAASRLAQAQQSVPEGWETANAVGDLMLRLSQWKATNPRTAPPAWAALVEACRAMVAASDAEQAEQAQAQPVGCSYCQHPLFAATKCPACGYVPAQAQQAAQPHPSAAILADKSHGSEWHMTMMMAPHQLHAVVGQDREHLLAFARDIWRAAKAKPEAQQHPDTQDAERYRWLRDEHIGDDPESISLRSGKTRGLDAAIDWQRIGASGEASNG